MAASRLGESSSTADLVAAVLDEEARRAPAAGDAPVDGTGLDLLGGPGPGAGGPELSVRDVFRTGGGYTLITTLFALNLVDEFGLQATSVLGPDIQKSLGISDSLLAVLGTLGGLIIILGTVPLGWAADRVRRLNLISATSVVLGVATMATGLVQHAWHLAVARVAAGAGKGNGPAYSSLLTDAFPIAGRARAFAVFNSANSVALLLTPVLAGLVAEVAGGDEGWRWAFLVLGVPTVLLGLAAAGLPEPERGVNEKQAIFGSEAVVLDETPPKLAVAFSRLRRIRSFYFFLVGLAVLGYALFAYPLFSSLFLEDHFGLDALERGYVLSFAAFGSLAGAAVGGATGDRLFRESPPRAILVGAGMIGLFLFNVVALYMPNVPLFVVCNAVGGFGTAAGFTMFTAVLASVIPYRLRAQGYAMVGIYIFVFGAFLGAMITGQLSDARGERVALSIVIPPAVLIGAAIMAYGARHVSADIRSAADELREEQAEALRIQAGGDVPVMQVRDLDFSYGQLQVLFDVAVEVRRGEVLALLGTNGAGKSTLLKVMSGLAFPSRGVVRFNGRTITYSEAEARVRMGIVQVPGGKAVFPSLTVAENLVAGAHTFIWEQDRLAAKLDEVLDLFPILRERVDQPAGTLSGGEQQMLAIAKGLLLDPEILLLDELSLGLAPVVVQEIIGVVERLKERGVTMVVVEQSVNVALALADRAVFMEKGRIRFEGPAQDLLERDDLVRAVFLGGEGG